MTKRITLDLTDEQIASLKSQGIPVEEKKGSFFVPKMGEEYYYLSEFGIRMTSQDDEYSLAILNSQAVYRTYEEAHKALEWRKAYTAILKYISDNNMDSGEWDRVEKHHMPIYDYSKNSFSVTYYREWQHSPLPLYVNSYDNCEKLIREQLDNLKILWGV